MKVNQREVYGFGSTFRTSRRTPARWIIASLIVGVVVGALWP